jgi:hypothetical protein
MLQFLLETSEGTVIAEKKYRQNIEFCLYVAVMLFYRNVQFIPFSFADKLGQIPSIVRLGTQTMTYLPVLGVEGSFLHLRLVDIDLLSGLYIIEFDARHGKYSLFSDSLNILYEQAPILCLSLA